MGEAQRNKQYDLLRFVGISCIILAHVGLNGTIFQLRNFDVPLMVLLSGIAYTEYSSNHYDSYFDYLKSRFFRMILPTWLFLIFYNTFSYIASGDAVAVTTLIKQAMFYGGVDIGIWIIRIFVSIALIAPFLYEIDLRFFTNKSYYIFSALCYITYELLHLLLSGTVDHGIMWHLDNIFFITIPYSLIFMYGLRAKKISKNDLQIHILLFGLLFSVYLLIGYFVCGKIVQTQPFKYPPKAYYLSFAMLVSVSLYYATKYHNLKIQNFKLIQYIGQSTLWIYLWHWFFLKLYHYINLPSNYLLKYLTVYSCTLIIVYSQQLIVKNLMLKIPDHSIKRRVILKSHIG